MKTNTSQKHVSKLNPISKQKWLNGIRPKVSIVCHAFNHEEYISDAIESFLIQETNFPVDIIINDDCSSDNTAKIIRKYQNLYPEIIKPIYRKHNLYSNKKSFTLDLYIQAEGDYIAYCDGDDYWTSKNKLQMQFETLEKNTDHIFCGHITTNFVDIKLDKIQFVNFNQILNDEMIAHTSSFFFKNIFKKFSNNKSKLPEYFFYGFNGDYSLSIYLTQYSECIVLPYNMSYYRIHSKGSFNSLKNNEGIIKKAVSMLLINQQLKYYLGSETYLNLSKKNLHYSLSINKRNILSFNIFGLIKSTIYFIFLLFEFISASALLYFQKKYKNK